MKKQNLCLFFLLSTILYVGCKDNKTIEPSGKINQITEKKTIASDSILLDNVIQFNSNEEETTYSVANFKLEYNPVENLFVIIKNNVSISEIDFDNRSFDGVGYNVFLYQSKKMEDKVLVFEAMADIGTAWYYFVMIKNQKVIKTFFVDEPRSNSEVVSLNDFLSISLKGQECLLKLDKKRVAQYSTIPQGIKTDKHFFYLTR